MATTKICTQGIGDSFIPGDGYNSCVNDPIKEENNSYKRFVGTRSLFKTVRRTMEVTFGLDMPTIQNTHVSKPQLSKKNDANENYKRLNPDIEVKFGPVCRLPSFELSGKRRCSILPERRRDKTCSPTTKNEKKKSRKELMQEIASSLSDVISEFEFISCSCLGLNNSGINCLSSSTISCLNLDQRSKPLPCVQREHLFIFDQLYENHFMNGITARGRKRFLHEQLKSHSDNDKKLYRKFLLGMSILIMHKLREKKRLSPSLFDLRSRASDALFELISAKLNHGAGE
eukprot:gb/GECH01013821.1/.p1 GENE.gb/GECH01013821.1/~~gb/GECH01013821.1/.p1  ORF type:complete len:287 (+),score=41.30 gb/GECH01013821.1/:1-861(+)